MRKICISTRFQCFRVKIGFLCFFALLLSVCFTLFFESYEASAFSFGSTRNILFDPGYGNSFITVWNGNSSGQGAGPYYNVPLTLSSDGNFMRAVSSTVDDSSGNLTAVQFSLNDTLPANSLFNFYVRYTTADFATRMEFRGNAAGNFVLLNTVCNTIAEEYDTTYSVTSGYSCTYWGYNSSALNYLQLTPSLRFVDDITVQTSRKLNVVQLITESGGGGSSGLTQADKEWLQTQIQSVVSSNNTGNTALSNISSEIQELNDRAEAEREEMEDNQDDLSDSAEDSSDEAESQGQTLLQAFSSFITAITNASPSNCKIDADMGRLDLGEIDLCELDPPPAFQTIASLLLIGFCVPLSIATANKVIALFRSFQS